MKTRSMKIRIIAVVAAAVLACTACGRGNAPAGPVTGANDSGTASATQSAADPATAPEKADSEATAALSDAEPQEAETAEGSHASWESLPLNVIDDNYRNYYEIFVYSYADSDGDGIGDLEGIRKKLPYIRDLGFNGIWLMPVMPSPTYHKYDVTDYCAIDPAYGTMEDLENLIKDAHDSGIRVIIDFVMNHSSSQHPWFLEACKYLKDLPGDDGRSLEELAAECPYVGYYHFSREKEGGTWYPVPGTSFYYEGEFWSEMPDLDYSSEALWSEFETIIPFWVGKGIDGFRMDATMHFEEGDTGFNTQVMNRVYEYAKSLNPEFYMVSEVWAGEKTIADYYASETPSLFNFDAGDAEGKLIAAARGSLKAEKLVQTMKQYEEDFGSAYEGYIDAPFLTNHDMGRVANALNGDEDAVRFAGGLLLSMSGSPFVYYGEEIGMKSKGTKDENKRLPMLWDYQPGGPGTPKPGTLSEDGTGMTKGPSDADPGIESKFPGVKEQLAEEDSILNYYRKALLIRNQNPEIARGKITIISGATDKDLAAIVKDHEGSRIAIVYNTSKKDSVNITMEQLKAAADALGEGKSAGNAEIAASEQDLISLPDGRSLSLVGSLTTDGSAIDISDGGMTLPPRSIVYLK